MTDDRPAARTIPTLYDPNRYKQPTQGAEKIGRRLQHAVDEAAAVAQIAAELSATLTGQSASIPARDPAPPNSKGVFAGIEHAAAQIEKRLEETRAALEAIRGHL